MDVRRCEVYNHCPLLAVGAYCFDSCYALPPASITDASGRVIAPPQPAIVARPRGPWDGNGK